MSQRSSDVPMLANFSIYIFPWDLLWTGLYCLKYIFSIDNNANQKSETFNKSQLSEFFDVPSPCTMCPWSTCIFASSISQQMEFSSVHGDTYSIPWVLYYYCRGTKPLQTASGCAQRKSLTRSTRWWRHFKRKEIELGSASICEKLRLSWVETCLL